MRAAIAPLVLASLLGSAGCTTLSEEIRIGFGPLPPELVAELPRPSLELPPQPTEADVIEAIKARLEWGEEGWDRIGAIREAQERQPGPDQRH